MRNSEPLNQLIHTLSRLPGVGRRTAERMAYRLVLDSRGLIDDLTSALQEIKNEVCTCSRCGNITLKSQDPCAHCQDRRRENHILCVVEDPAHIALIESSGGFQGRYHVLGAKISPMKGEDVTKDKTDKLLKRIREESVEEVILALDTDVESDATASCLHDLLLSHKVRVTRLAFGLPAGSGIGYSDPVTLSRAIQGRQPL